MGSYAWLILALPVASFVVLVLTGRRLGRASAYVSIGAIVGAFLVSVAVLGGVVGGESLNLSAPWLVVGGLELSFGLLIDRLTALMLIVVTSVAAFVQIYSIGYMHGEKRYSWYYAAMSLFAAAMLLLVLAPNYVQLYIAWELVGLCSYLLIGFWFERKAAADAAKKAFLVTRVGDIGFLIGLFVLYYSVGSLDMATVFGVVKGLAPGMATLVSLLIFSGAVGKSAQFPLHVWLPDAMEGPTPVSALIHAATMVAAGVYLVARSYPIFEQSAFALQTVATIGALTALMAATIALVTVDIKRILAYSTISQLGYMMIGLGVGAPAAGIFHLMTHAFFKALLFLSVGSVIHAAHTQNIFELGGLARRMKVTTFGFVFGALSLAGVPPFSGFWSKDEIIAETLRTGHPVIFAIALFTALLTGFYIFRLCFLAFYGQNPKLARVHESPATMTAPMGILAILALSAGLIGSPFLGYRLQGFLAIGGEVAHLNPMIMALSITFGLAGIAVAWAMYSDSARLVPAGAFAWAAGIHRVLSNQYYVNEIYHAIFVQPAMRLADAMRGFDLGVIDAAVNGLAGFVARLGAGLRRVQTGYVQSYGLMMLVGLTVLIMWTFGYLNMF